MSVTLHPHAQAAAQEAQDRSTVYAYLSLGLLYPEPGVVEALQGAQGPLAAALDRLQAPPVHQAAQRLRKAWGRCDPARLALLHERTISLATGCVPYETEYDQAHIFQKSHQMADIVAFYRAFGLELAPDLKDRADHISVELEFMHFLAAKEAHALLHEHGADKVALCREAQRAFLGTHLEAWGVDFSHRLAATDPQGLYGALGRFLEAFLASETAAFALPPPGPLDLLQEEEEELDPACETCPLVTGEGAIWGGRP